MSRTSEYVQCLPSGCIRPKSTRVRVHPDRLVLAFTFSSSWLSLYVAKKIKTTSVGVGVGGTGVSDVLVGVCVGVEVSTGVDVGVAVGRGLLVGLGVRVAVGVRRGVGENAGGGELGVAVGRIVRLAVGVGEVSGPEAEVGVGEAGTGICCTLSATAVCSAVSSGWSGAVSSAVSRGWSGDVSSTWSAIICWIM